MRRMLIIALTALFAVTGCESRQHKLDQLSAQYKVVNKQYNDDCVAPAYGAKGADSYLKGTKPKVPTQQEEAAHNQKCAIELKQVTSVEQQIAALSK
jgi:hypothetical protein